MDPKGPRNIENNTFLLSTLGSHAMLALALYLSVFLFDPKILLSFLCCSEDVNRHATRENVFSQPTRAENKYLLCATWTPLGVSRDTKGGA